MSNLFENNIGMTQFVCVIFVPYDYCFFGILTFIRMASFKTKNQSILEQNNISYVFYRPRYTKVTNNAHFLYTLTMQ